MLYCMLQCCSYRTCAFTNVGYWTVKCCLFCNVHYHICWTAQYWSHWLAKSANATCAVCTVKKDRVSIQISMDFCRKSCNSGIDIPELPADFPHGDPYSICQTGFLSSMSWIFILTAGWSCSRGGLIIHGFKSIYSWLFRGYPWRSGWKPRFFLTV